MKYLALAIICFALGASATGNKPYRNGYTQGSRDAAMQVRKQVYQEQQRAYAELLEPFVRKVGKP